MPDRLTLALGVALCLTLAAACAAPSASGGPARPATRSPGQQSAAAPPATLAEALHAARTLGPTDPREQIQFSLSLRGRDPQGLARLLDSGQTVTAPEYAARFGPDPRLVQSALGELRQVGLEGSWEQGSTLLAARGPAGAVDRYFSVSLRDYRLPDGTRFHAADRSPRVPTALSGLVTAVSGLDDFTRYTTHTIRPGGLIPTDLRVVYGLDSLISQGLDGTGQTIVFPEIDDLPNMDDLNAYASKYNLPPFNVTVKRDSANWGNPENPGKPGSEVTLDLELVHSAAPGAKLVAYISSAKADQTAVAFDALVNQNPGAIISDSIGACEAGVDQAQLQQGMASNQRAVAQGMSHFVASGDRGAYDCGQNNPPSVDFPSALPTVTSVGGTTLFQTPQGTYQKEAAWGSPIAQAGGGGGLSQNFARPSYQAGPGVDNDYSNGNRQVPDVAAVADQNSGYNIIIGGKSQQVGGTSAAAPVWAGVTGLIDQDLGKKGLKPVGFANPALYWMAENPGKLTASPFHQVTEGNNLVYPAGPGWNYCTGLGSFQAVALDRAFEAYQHQGGS